jgi:hypothetical protein
MTIIDSQVHAYEANTPKRPWHSVPNWPAHATGDEMVAAMDKVGVDGAIFISSFSMYRYDASYAVETQRTHPGRFAIVKPVDPDDPGVADVVADWKSTPGAVGIRIMLTKEANRGPNDPGLDRILRAAVRHDFPVNILCWGNLDAGTALVDRNPDARFIIDHLGIMQPRMPPAPPQPWADLPKVLELARKDRGETFRFPVGERQRVVGRDWTPLGRPGPAVGITAQAARPRLHLDQDETDGCQNKCVDLVHAALIVDELEVRPGAPRLMVGQVIAQEIQRFPLPLECGLTDCRPTP